MADIRSRFAWLRSLGKERGFTLVEVTVMIAVLSVGVLGTVALIDGANSATSSNKAREGATALHRELIEMTRSVPYGQLTESGVQSALESRPTLADSSNESGYTIARRGFTYTLTITSCSFDDAADGVGTHDSGVTWCSDSAGPGSTDRNADDYKRVTLRLSWARGGKTESSRQTTILTNPSGGLGPSVKTLTSPTASPLTTDIASIHFNLTTSSTPQSVQWLINGDVKGAASGSGTSWGFDWAIQNPDGTPLYLDGTYLVQAQAFDSGGRTGTPKTFTMVLNRSAALKPTGFAGGRNGNGNGSHVDLEWNANGEGDIVGYRVYRSDSSGNLGTRACPPATAGADAYTAATSCVDDGAPGGSLHYVAVALDTLSGGGLREGTKTAAFAIAEGNNRPSAPSGLALCAGGSAGCNAADGTPAGSSTTVLTWSAASDPDSGDSIQFYRIYRDGTAYSHRYGRLYPGGPLIWVDRNPGSSTHSYRVSAVDSHFGESPLTSPVTG